MWLRLIALNSCWRSHGFLVPFWVSYYTYAAPNGADLARVSDASTAQSFRALRLQRSEVFQEIAQLSFRKQCG